MACGHPLGVGAAVKLGHEEGRLAFLLEMPKNARKCNHRIRNTEHLAFEPIRG